ncbi:hypothetical protein UFOVP1326_42 [uncultured Caudovirales phage]|uniref:Uncharacterized protein n=1 Tax=uncultured Caudovirales phage TaxID=2100421 RepID=A0A6J5SGA4_9CAUD|nr:hypothetical protein UFOVP1326_42 [uncultured Caudovirales phage]CAB4212970.1 hypothetical protein UFOVP1436_49 [uncultured Caudovirales phage]
MRHLLVTLILLAGCTPPDPVWYPSKTRAPGTFKPYIVEAAKLPKACNTHAWGCYVPEDIASATPGRIYILLGLHDDDKACVLEHEMKHWRGLDHDPGLADCG